MSCESCNKHNTEDAAKRNPVPRAIHESDMDRADRANKRLFAALIVAIVLFFASNALWLWAWMSYDYTGEESTVEIEALDGVANYIGGAGTIRNGE